MKVSIITPSYNQGEYIEQTIKSIVSQQGDFELEPIIIDGGSTDNTIEILKNYDSQIKWISEKDNGQADAINKGIRMSSGEIIGWLNSDDLYHQGTIKRVVEFFRENKPCQWLYGKCRIINEDNKEIRQWITYYKNINLRIFSLSRLIIENYISQPTIFFRKEIIDKVGELDSNLHYSMDYDLWLRFAKIGSAGVLKEYLADFRWYQNSKSGRDFKKQFCEEHEVAKKHFKERNFLLFLHKLNIYRNISIYSVMKLFTN